MDRVVSSKPPSLALRLGITGGIGSGKSTVSTLLSARGAAVVDADALSRAVTAPHGAAIDAIRLTFGPGFIDDSGALDRQAMREHVFADPTAKKRLESIVHPLVAAAIHAAEHDALRGNARCIVYDIPLLAESGDRWRARLDRVLVVDCRPEVQVERVRLRSGLDQGAVMAIIGAQASRPDRLRVADWVLFNDGLSLQGLESEVDSIARMVGL